MNTNMNTMTVVFGRSSMIGSVLIRLFTWSRWSHVGIVDGDMVIEAVGFKGVIITPLSEFKARYSSTELASFPCKDNTLALTLAYREVGKGYDWGAIIGHIIRRRYDNPDKWVCSELVAHVSGVVRKDRVSSVSPEDIFKFSQGNTK